MKDRLSFFSTDHETYLALGQTFGAVFLQIKGEGGRGSVMLSVDEADELVLSLRRRIRNARELSARRVAPKAEGELA